MKRFAGRIWGPVNAEDLVGIPGTDWVLTSGMQGPTAPLGRLYAVDRRDLSCTEIYPYTADTGSLDPAVFEPHGIDVAVAADGTPELLVVDHGGGESVARFAIDLGGDRPVLTHLETVPMPAGVWGNDVAALPGGGFVLSSTTDISDGLEKGMARMGAGEETGCAVEWTPGAGCRVLPGSAINSANGVAVSPDGGTVFLAGWRSRCIRKITRGAGDPVVETLDVDVMVDNLTWTPDGALLAAGATDATMEDFAAAYFGPVPRVAFPSRVLRIDPDTLAVETVAEQADPALGVATTALAVGDEIWVGAARDQGLQRYR
ncbi:hypothetical protein GCM10009836_54410 [Pseudonocardia ailaonensis]|uniref:SMP-30/Gluconolactonase/LRE-like region domain-containing protein n=1 Tax=Pseudonocardia ailaonensis TaxID=367279 RepID=A0ABN2NFN2_9PSEU